MNKQFTQENLYYGFCEYCKKRYENIPESQTHMQFDGKCRFISCNEVMGYNKLHNVIYCGNFVELFLQPKPLEESLEADEIK